MWSRSGSYEFDNNGNRATGAIASFFVGGTSTPFAVYEDAEENTAYTEDVTTDGNGRWPAVFIPFGTYKIRITTSGGTTLFTADNIPNPEPVDTSASVDPDAIFQTGDYLFVGKNGTRTGFVRANGRTIGSATSSATERANADCEDLFVFVWDNYADAQCAVSGGRGGSGAADWASNKRIALPDHRSASMIGLDDMGNTAAGLAASAPVVSGSAILAGSLIGANTHTLLTAELATHSHVLSALATVTSAGGHSHTYSGTSSSDNSHSHTYSGTTGTESVGIPPGSPGIVTATGGGGGTYWHGSTGLASAHTHGYSGTTSTQSDHTHTYSGTTSSQSAHTHVVGGTTDNACSGGAHNNLSRSIPVTVLMKL
jgi:hypothetical protein